MAPVDKVGTYLYISKSYLVNLSTHILWMKKLRVGEVTGQGYSTCKYQHTASNPSLY